MRGKSRRFFNNGFSTMKCALTGCGRISKKHFDAIDQNGIELVGVCDIIKKKSFEASKQYNVAEYNDYKELNKQKFDLLSICTYPSQHYKIAKDAIENDHDVLIEKPATLRLDEIKLLSQIAQYNKKMIFEVKQNRYNKAIRELKSAIDSGLFGKIHLVLVRLLWCRFNGYFTQDEFNWRGTYLHDGGVFASQGCHHVDMLRWLIGDIKSVSANGYNTILDIECEDTGTATIQFSNGCLGIINATNAMRPENIEASVTVVGEKGSVVVSGTHLNEITYWGISGSKLSEKIEEHGDIYGNGHIKVYENILKWYNRDNSAEIVDWVDSYKTISLINAIYKSMETGKIVDMLYDNIVSKRLGV